MTFANRTKTAEGASVLAAEYREARFRPGSQATSNLKSVFIRSNSGGAGALRAGWRIVIFLLIFGVSFAGSALIRFGGPHGLRRQYSSMGQTVVTPTLMVESEAIAMLILYGAALIMGKLEHREFAEYGLPLRQAMGKDFWIGVVTGFLTISGTLLAMFLLHGFRVTGLALHGAAIMSSAGAWGLAYLLAGLVEEFLCRGYVQYTLAGGIGFWPAAIAVSGLFGLGHAFNSRETVTGSIAVVLFGLLLCLFLRRTGNLWCAVGFHAAYDWGQMFYGVPDSGIVPYHNVLSSAFSGPHWLTGGMVGPEASVLTPIALLAAATVFSLGYGKKSSAASV
jgi:uncharacterized protein